MPGIHRLGDANSGHSCPPYSPDGTGTPSACAKGCPTVLVNGRPAATLGDVTTLHLCIGEESVGIHAGIYIMGRTVLAGGRPVQAMGDLNSCAAVLVNGSPNVIVGG